jgi:uncharacterized membrane protein HdeD (DUF308 family)
VLRASGLRVSVHHWSGLFLYLLSALLRGVTGYLLIRYPFAGEISLTLVLASFFIVGGTFQAIGAGALQFPRWGWAAYSGIVSVALGIMLLMQLPVSSLWFITSSLVSNSFSTARHALHWAVRCACTRQSAMRRQSAVLP